MYDSDFAAFQELLANTKQENGVFARFYDKSVKTGQLTKDGLPVFEAQTFVEIRLKDNNCDIYDQPADREKISRFPIEYNRYLLSKKQVDNGSPLEQFAFLDVAQIDSLKSRGVFTVETLAEIPEDKANELGINKERILAIKFLQNNQGNEALLETEKKQTELEDALKKEKNAKEALQDEVKRLQGEIAELQKQLETTSAKSNSK